MESPLKFRSVRDSDVDQVLCYPTHCSISERDNLVATGTLKMDSDAGMESCLGLEFAGYDDRGDRVIGIVPYHVSRGDRVIGIV